MKIYVAHTYGRRHGLSDEECEKNVQKSIHWGIKVLNKGHNPFIPNLYHYVHKQMGDYSFDESVWLSLVSSWLVDCEAIFVAEMPKWEGSGVMRELVMAQSLNKKVFYDIDEIPDIGVA